MPDGNLARWQDLLVIAINLCIMVAIGVYCARKTRSADGYFLANRSMPGWIVAFSMMATIVSSMTFLAMPAATFKDNWLYMPAHVLYFIPAAVAYLVFMPFFRRGHVRTAYEYLELRFGTWARVYGAVAFLFYHIFRAGIILYAVSLAIQRMSGFELPYVICALGILVAAYTIAGGLEAVIYTDVLQGLALIAGGLICTPIIAGLLPGGFSQIFTEAYADGKFSVGSTALVFDEKTVWVIILVYQFQFLQIVCTDQSMVQRYLAMKTDREARRGFVLGTALTIPVWLYFAFVGTALYVLYKHFPDPALASAKPEEIFPYFILTQVPAGVAGFVISGVLAAAMSTLDSSINASAATVTTDFYRRFRPSSGNDRHYLLIGRWFSVLFSLIMIGVALLIHFMRTDTLMDLQTIVYPIVSAGLLSLFLLGFMTVRVGSKAALIATLLTVLLVGGWVVLASEWGQESFPYLADHLPNQFWIGVIPHVFLLIVGYLLSFFLPRSTEKRLEDLTIWTKSVK
ncbi:MAG: sodium/solute symporter [Planctomycetaceae bacterium]|jgi:solute:Na+ symporter, SSS family|nr:sodium/solute symporter [Planctomycetaceae bacterium]MBT6495980.1 sodium/solute symporter [Planctomycetaceae bacterium]